MYTVYGRLLYRRSSYTGKALTCTAVLVGAYWYPGRALCTPLSDLEIASEIVRSECTQYMQKQRRGADACAGRSGALLLPPLSDDVAQHILCFLSANDLLNGFGLASKRSHGESLLSTYWCELYCSRFHQQVDGEWCRQLDWHAICRRAWCMAARLGRYCSWYQVDRLERGCWYGPVGTAHLVRRRHQDGSMCGDDVNVLPPPPDVRMAARQIHFDDTVAKLSNSGAGLEDHEDDMARPFVTVRGMCQSLILFNGHQAGTAPWFEGLQADDDAATDGTSVEVIDLLRRSQVVFRHLAPMPQLEQCVLAARNAVRQLAYQKVGIPGLVQSRLAAARQRLLTAELRVAEKAAAERSMAEQKRRNRPPLPCLNMDGQKWDFKVCERSRRMYCHLRCGVGGHIVVRSLDRADWDFMLSVPHGLELHDMDLVQGGDMLVVGGPAGLCCWKCRADGECRYYGSHIASDDASQESCSDIGHGRGAAATATGAEGDSTTLPDLPVRTHLWWDPVSLGKVDQSTHVIASADTGGVDGNGDGVNDHTGDAAGSVAGDTDITIAEDWPASFVVLTSTCAANTTLIATGALESRAKPPPPLRVYDAKTGERVCEVAQTSRVCDFALGALLVAADSHGDVRVWDPLGAKEHMQGASLLAVLRAESLPPLDRRTTCLNTSGDWCAAGMADGEALFVWRRGWALCWRQCPFDVERCSESGQWHTPELTCDTVDILLNHIVVHATAAAVGELAEDESPVAAIIVCVDDASFGARFELDVTSYEGDNNNVSDSMPLSRDRSQLAIEASDWQWGCMPNMNESDFDRGENVLLDAGPQLRVVHLAPCRTEDPVTDAAVSSWALHNFQVAGRESSNDHPVHLVSKHVEWAVEPQRVDT